MKTETELKQQNTLLIKVLEEVVEYNESHTSSTDHAEIKKILKPYLAYKIQPWTKWRYEKEVYILCVIEGKYQLNALDGTHYWTDPADTPIGAFGDFFYEFTKAED